MFLKRLLMTTLGALGLSVLAAGPASAQQVPAPSYFDDQVACSARSSMAAMTATTGSVDPLVKTNMGMGPTYLAIAQYGASGEGAPQEIEGTNLAILNYIVPNTVANCGNGAAFVDGTDASYDLAQGYTQIVSQYNLVKAAKTELDAAEKALKDLTSTAPDSEREAAQTRYNNAVKDYNAKNDELSARTAGPVYAAGLAEYKAQEAVNEAIGTTAGDTGWNAKFGPRNTALATLDGSSHADNVALNGGAQGLLDALTDTEGDLVVTAVDNYIGFGSNGVTDGFDSSGKLLTADAAAATVSTIKANLESAENAVEAIKEAQKDANTILAPKLVIALNQAEQQRNHLQTQLANAYADNTDLDGADGIQSIAARKAAFDKADSELNVAGSKLTAAVKARAAATGDVLDAFQGATSYFEQDVARHQYLTDNATGSAKEDAQKVLTSVTKIRDDHKAFVETGGPAVALADALLVPNGDDDDDDGQALVDAVVANHMTASDAKATADDVKASVEGLIGDEGQVGQNTAAIAENADDITALDGRVTVNEGTIADNTVMIMKNSDGIVQNATNIMTNADNIDKNSTAITANSGRIDANAAAIEVNTGAIADNTNAIGSNSAAIQRNSGMIGELSESLETVRAGVAASMALAGMPAINGRGISIGVGSFDGESAFAVGFMIQGEMASFKVGVTSAGGATGASAGVGFQF